MDRKSKEQRQLDVHKELLECICADCHGGIFYDSFESCFNAYNALTTDQDFIDFAKAQYDMSLEASDKHTFAGTVQYPLSTSSAEAFWRWYFKYNASHAELAGTYCAMLYERADWIELDAILKLLRTGNGRYEFDS